MLQSIKYSCITLQRDDGRFAHNTARLKSMQECDNICSRTMNPTVAEIAEQVDILEEDFSALTYSSRHEAQFHVLNIKDLL